MEKNSLFNRTTKSVSESSEQIISQLKNGISKITDLGKISNDKFVKYVKDVFDVLPLLENAGFKTNRLIIGISIPPSIEIHFCRFKEISEKEADMLLDQYRDKKMFKLIFKALRMSNDFQGKLSSDSLIFSETCIEISIPPKISIKYLNRDIANLRKIETGFD